MIDTIIEYITAHPAQCTFYVMYVGMAAANTAPSPEDLKNHSLGEILYQWAYDFLHVISNRAAVKYPQLSFSQPQPTNQPDPNGPK